MALARTVTYCAGSSSVPSVTWSEKRPALGPEWRICRQARISRNGDRLGATRFSAFTGAGKVLSVGIRSTGTNRAAGTFRDEQPKAHRDSAEPKLPTTRRYRVFGAKLRSNSARSSWNGTEKWTNAGSGAVDFSPTCAWDRKGRPRQKISKANAATATAAMPTVQVPAETEARRSLPLAKRPIPQCDHGLRADPPTAAGNRLLFHRHWQSGIVSPIGKVDCPEAISVEKSFCQAHFS